MLIQQQINSDKINYINIRLNLSQTRDTYKRTVFTIFDLFGTVGGMYSLITSAWGLIVGVVSTQIMLSSVFRRLYFTNQPNHNDIAIDNVSKDRRESKVVEEDKDNSKFRFSTIDSKIEDNKPIIGFKPNLENNMSKYQDHYLTDQNVQERLGNILKDRMRYKANWMHKILTFIPSCMWKYKGIIRK